MIDKGQPTKIRSKKHRIPLMLLILMVFAFYQFCPVWLPEPITIALTREPSETTVLFQKMFSSAKNLYGPPRFRVNLVIILCGVTARTKCVDRNLGVYVLELRCGEKCKVSEPQLAHETMHLLNFRLLDAYVEGLNQVFSEQFLRTNFSDGAAERAISYAATHEPFYAAAYDMMSDLNCIAPSNFRKILNFATSDDEGRMFIDINAWLRTLPPFQRKQAIAAIMRNESKILESKPNLIHFASP